ncbi:MAG: ATP-dependent DNA helicase RecG [Clostridia bacterium]|nr:ATP-dependent DNA helicase RecG [Clostridia bacterium]
MRFSDPVEKLKGVGPKMAAVLSRLDINTVGDLLDHKPAYYKDLSQITPIYAADEGSFLICKGTVTSSPRWIKRTGGFSLFSFTVADGTGTLTINIFNIPYLFKNYKIGDTYYFLGRAKAFHRKLQMDNPEVIKEENLRGIAPYYPLTSGLTQNKLKTIIKNALETAEYEDMYSDGFLSEYGLLHSKDDYRFMHFPESMDELSRSKRSLSLKEILVFLKTLELTAVKREETKRVDIDDSVLDEFLSLLPFKCTGAQIRAMKDILSDIRKDRVANRLIQGDVGSGKTAVALFGVYAMKKAGLQSLILAPTSLLAEQHYNTAKNIFGDEVRLLKGAASKKEHEELNSLLSEGKVSVLISTHAVLYEHFDFRALKLMIIDEQHRFGVEQRSFLMNSYPGIHKISMSATPIPRSLAMILHGNADISLLDEMPEGRMPVKTFILRPNKREDMYDWAAGRIRDLDEKAYIVCPLLEESEELPANSVMNVYEELRKRYPDIPIEFIHGKMKNQEKQDIMQRFKTGETRMLVSTTVVEVGVDVQDATMMIIENADRFGLAQLHQLRGRVGRGSRESFCYLISDGAGMERLKVLKDSNDGFYIAKKDLEFRGTGNFFGTEQHGDMTFVFADLLRDMDLFEEGKQMLSVMERDFREDYEALLTKVEDKIKDENNKYIVI